MLSPNHFTMETPSQLRTIRCGLPPLLPFPPDPTNTADRNIEQSDSDEYKSRGQKLWAMQLKEEELMNTANRRIRWILNRLGAHINSLENSASDERDLFPNNHSRVEENDAYQLTIFDLNGIARKLNGLSCEFDIFSEPGEKLESTSEEVDDTAYFRYWNENISIRFPDRNIPLCWSAVLALPLKDAASDILALYEVNSDTESNGEGIRNYLQYQAAETLRNIQELVLPSVKNRLKQKQTLHHKMQMTQKEFTNRYNKTFEQLDDYCMNVLRVESDILPLCPLENEESLEYAATIDSYARDIGKCAFEPLRKEFHTLSDRFVKLLTGVTMESSGERRHHGKSISHGITYYRRFIEFILSSQDRTNHQQSLDRESEAPLETLYQFTTDIGSNDNHHGATCLSQLMNSPAVRAKLVSDLRQLDVFLSCRKREIARTSSIGFGHTLAEAIDMEWTQFCIRRGGNETAEHSKVSSEDVIRFQEATRFVFTQIVGDGAHAKRLRLLADAVGYTSNDEATAGGSFSWHFNALCRKAANLSRQMTFFDEQAKRMTKAITQLATEIDVIQAEVRVMENRIACICDGLKVE